MCYEAGNCSRKARAGQARPAGHSSLVTNLVNFSSKPADGFLSRLGCSATQRRRSCLIAPWSLRLIASLPTYDARIIFGLSASRNVVGPMAENAERW